MSVQTEHPTFDKTYAEVQQFYARHIHLLDAGKPPTLWPRDDVR